MRQALARLFNTVLFSGKSLARLEQSQNEAVIDALALAMVVDDEVVEEEKAQLVRALRLFGWSGDRPVEQYVDEALQLAQAAKDDPARFMEYLFDISDRLNEKWVREEVYFQCGHIVGADKEVHESERDLLERLSQAFEINPERQREITTQLIREMDFA